MTTRRRGTRARPVRAPATSRTSRRRATPGRVNEGQTVLTNGMNVGGRAGTPVGARRAAPPRAKTLDVQAGQGLGCRSLNAATIRFMRLRLTSTHGGTLIPLSGSAARAGSSTTRSSRAGCSGGFDTEVRPRARSCSPPGSRADVVAAIPAGRDRRADAVDRGLPAHRQGFCEHPDRPGRALQSSTGTAPSDRRYTIAARHARCARRPGIRSRRSAPATGRCSTRPLRAAEAGHGDARTIQLTQNGHDRPRDQRRLSAPTTSPATTRLAPHLGSARYATARATRSS